MRSLHIFGALVLLSAALYAGLIGISAAFVPAEVRSVAASSGSVATHLQAEAKALMTSREP
jgi:hypothetical protein